MGRISISPGWWSRGSCEKPNWAPCTEARWQGSKCSQITPSQKLIDKRRSKLKRKQKVKVQNQKSLHLFTNTTNRGRCECRKRRNRMDSGEIMWGTNARSSSARVEEARSSSWDWGNSLSVSFLFYFIFLNVFFSGKTGHGSCSSLSVACGRRHKCKANENCTVLIWEINKLNERPARDRHLQKAQLVAAAKGFARNCILIVLLNLIFAHSILTADGRWH